jgi:hypothetical protein
MSNTIGNICFEIFDLVDYNNLQNNLNGYDLAYISIIIHTDTIFTKISNEKCCTRFDIQKQSYTHYTVFDNMVFLNNIDFKNDQQYDDTWYSFFVDNCYAFYKSFNTYKKKISNKIMKHSYDVNFIFTK